MVETRVQMPVVDCVTDPRVRRRVETAGLRLADALTRRGRFHEVQVLRIVKAYGNRVVAEAVMDGQHGFLKLLAGDGASAAIDAMRAELHTAARLTTPEAGFGFARVIFAAPRFGLIGTETAPGVRLDNAIEAADPAGREALIARAGGWLAWYCAPRRASRRFDAGRFLARHNANLGLPRTLQAVAARPDDCRRVVRLTHYLMTEALRRHRLAVSIAATHGDFVSRNLNVTADAMTAFDIDGKPPVAVAEDAAHFLVYQHMRRRGPTPPEAICGIDALDWQAFIGSGVLDAAEAEAILPLFVAKRMLLELGVVGSRPAWGDRLRAAIDGFMDAPPSLGAGPVTAAA